MVARALSTPQLRDPGSEAAAGYDYQWHVTARMCIQMLADKEVEYIVCEFHEDVVQIRRELHLELIQVKKKESGNWTLSSLIRPERRQKRAILSKLFDQLQKGKDISRLVLLGYGRVSGNGDFSLLELIGLLNLPDEGRDANWKSRIQRYVDFLSRELTSQGVDPAVVAKGISILEIDFNLPHPDGVESQNRDLLDETLRKMWNVELSVPEVDEVYQELYNRVRKVSIKPKQPWHVKAISRQEALDMVFSRVKVYAPSLSRRELMATQDKLTSAKMARKVFYALQQRLDAMQLRFELGIGAAQWEGFRTEIDARWREFRASNPRVQGPALWQALRVILSDLGQVWAEQDRRMGPDFAEGVFFDMTGTCEAEWRVSV